MGGTILGGGSSGGSSGGSQNNAYSKALANISKDYWAQTAPLRDVFMGDYLNFLAPGQYTGNYSTSNMGGGKTFNLGIGLVFVVAPEEQERLNALLREKHEEPLRIGEVVSKKL